MELRKKIIVIMLVFIIGFQGVALASKPNREILADNLAVSLVIDTSASMEDTDPEGLREMASHIFIDLLSPEDYLGLIVFNSEAEEVLAINKIGDKKDTIKNTLAENLVSQGNTDYKKALDLANLQLSSLDLENTQGVVIFLTDGQPSLGREFDIDLNAKEDYFNDMWTSIGNLGVKGYPIYSLGLGQGIDSDILDRIAMTTKGHTIFTSDIGNLTLDLYKILVDLKRSNIIVNESFNLNGQEEISFKIDEFTDSLTLIIVNEDGDVVNLTPQPPSNVSLGQGGVVNRNSRYTIVSLQQEDNNLLGDWKFNIGGQGNIKVFGARDNTLKSVIVSPSHTISHPVNEPINITVGLDGIINDSIKVDLHVYKPGALTPIKVETEKSDDFYMGTFEETNLAGAYEIIARVIYQGNLINTSTRWVNVKNLPSIISDFPIKKDGYSLGQGVNLTAWLNMGNTRIYNSSDLRIDSFDFNLLYDDGSIMTFPLGDDGVSGDVRANDGYWTSLVDFNKSGHVISSLNVRGAYKGEGFALEKPLGEFEVTSLEGNPDVIQAEEGEGPSQARTPVSPISKDMVLYILASILLALLAFLLLGKIFYIRLVKSKLVSKARLSYRAKDISQAYSSVDILLKAGEDFLISFDNKEEADLNLSNIYYDFDILIKALIEKENKDFILGWKALGGSLPLSYLEISCQAPGFFVMDRQVYNRKILNHGDRFTVGNYDFIFEKLLVEDGKGKNILEGKV